MDEHGQVGPEKGDYGRDVRAVATLMATLQRSVYVPFAANGTRLGLLLTRKADLATLRATPEGLAEVEGDPWVAAPAGWVHVSVANHGSYWFNLATYLNDGYIASKLDVTATDGAALGEFLTRLRVGLLAALTPHEVPVAGQEAPNVT